MTDDPTPRPQRTYPRRARLYTVSAELTRQLDGDRPAFARAALGTANDLAIRLARAEPGTFVYLLTPDGRHVTSACFARELKRDATPDKS